MSNKITLNLNQSPYYDDFDENKNFHQILYKPALPVQARELTQEQSILEIKLRILATIFFGMVQKLLVPILF